MQQAQGETQNILQLLFRKLGPQYQPAMTSWRHGLLLGIAEKAPPGQRFKNGQKMRFIGGPTPRQFRLIANTSRSNEEAADRLIQLVVHKNDTTVNLSQSNQLDVAKMAEMVRAEVAKLLRQGVHEMAANKERLEEVAAQAADRVLTGDAGKTDQPEETPKFAKPAKPRTPRDHSPTPKKKLGPKAAGALIDAENAAHRQRAEMLGIDISDIPLQYGSRRYAKKWVAKLDKMWTANSKGEPIPDLLPRQEQKQPASPASPAPAHETDDF